MLFFCLLSSTGQRVPIYRLYTTCRSLNSHVVPTLAASFLASFETPRSTTETSNVMASGYHRLTTLWALPPLARQFQP